MKKFNLNSFGGTVFVGIVTCIVWAILSDHLFPYVTSRVVEFSSFFNHRIFINVSYHDLVALQQSTYMLVAVFFVSLYIMIFSGFYYAFIQFKKEYDDSKSELYALKNRAYKLGNTEEETTKTPTISLEELQQEMKDSIELLEKRDKFFEKAYLVAKFVLPATFIVFLCVAGYSTITTKYVYEAISYYDYLLNVNAANLDDKTERAYMTRFSQIRSSQDYRNIIVELENLAFMHGHTILPNPTVRSDKDLKEDHPTIMVAEEETKKK
ncbi:hypothetical protein ABFP12_17205 [Acinetobacter baumannii]